MQLKDFEQILSMKTEIEVLTKRLQKHYGGDYVADTAKDYSTGYERIITISGYTTTDVAKVTKISDKIKSHKKKLEDKLMEAEEYILSVPDSRIRTLLTLRYLEGETWDGAANKFYKNMSGDAARKAVNTFFMEV